MSPADEELDFHIEMLTRRYVEEGLDPEAARQKALARMGHVRAVARNRRSLPMPTMVMQDIRYALRTFRRTPVFTATALITLAVGIGATTAIFSVVHAVLLRDLPYPNAGRAMYVFNSYAQEGLEEAAMSPEEFADLKSQAQTFERLAAMRPQMSALTDDCPGGGCEPLRVNAVVVSSDLFDLLGVRPSLGRPFATSDGVSGAERVVLLSDSLWQRRYGADPGIVGRTISLGGLPRVVIGVMPPSVQMPDEAIGYLRDRADLWIPFNWEQTRDGRGNQYLEVLGLRKEGVSAGQVTADLERIASEYKTRFPTRYAEPSVRWALRAKSLTDEMVGDVRLGLMVLFGAVGCVLLIAFANVGNLLLARGAARHRELAVRSALGAGRSRLVQQLLVETLVLTGLGALLGVGVAAGGLKLLLALNPGGIPRLDLVRIDATVLAFTGLLALVAGTAVGLLPAFRQSAAGPQQALADGRSAGAGALRRGLRGALVVAEVALAVVVLTGAALLIRSYAAITSTPAGFDPDRVAVARLTIPRAQYDQPAKVFAFHTNVRDGLAAIPGVVQASAVYPLPMSPTGWSGTVGIAGRPETPGVPQPHAEFAVALPGYFSTAAIPLLEGRDFTDADHDAAPAVVIVDAVFAQQYFPGRSPIGARLAINGNLQEGPFQTIIGIVGHVRNRGARQEGEGQIYLSALQKQEFSLFFVTKTAAAPSLTLPSIRAVVREQDPRLPVALLTTMEDVVATFTARDRFNTVLFTIFAGVALAIAAVGLYGVLAFLVTQRTREMAIRLALGGGPAGLVRSVVAEGLSLTVVGLVAGLAGTWFLARGMGDLLFGVTPADPAAYTIIAVTMVVVACAAAYGPARRATRVDPVDVLRG